ncbi:MAG TPA: DUF4097 family beta strand repeat-containing protein [Solirubrobacteraceae bacterium]|jgi:DUF4097 and DUF4098 domain-containing protein YvlB
MKKLIVVIVLLVVLVGGALTIVNFVLDHRTVKTHTVAQTVRGIVVKSGSGHVDLIPASRRITVRETQHYVFNKPKLEQSVHNGVLTLNSDCNVAVIKCYADLRIAVPAGMQVTVQADSGDVDAREIDVRSGHMGSDSGDVRLSLVGRQQLVWAHTDSGYVEVIAADARAVDAQADSGDVAVDVFRRAPRRVLARTDSGSVQVLVPKGDYAVQAHTDSGDVKIAGITRNDHAPNSIQVQTDSGNIAIRAR